MVGQIARGEAATTADACESGAVCFKEHSGVCVVFLSSSSSVCGAATGVRCRAQGGWGGKWMTAGRAAERTRSRALVDLACQEAPVRARNFDLDSIFSFPFSHILSNGLQ